MNFNHLTPNYPLDVLETRTINEKRYYVLPDGKLVPSVTTVVNFGSKFFLKKWRDAVGDEEADRISNISSSRGNALHLMCEKYLCNDPFYKKGMMPEPISFFASIKPYLDRINNIRYVEAALWSKSLGLAGRTDVIGEFDEEIAIIDFKNSRKIKTLSKIKNYCMQTTAYAIMHEERTGIPISKIVIIIANENAPPSLFVQKKENYEEHLHEIIKAWKKYNKPIDNLPPPCQNLFTKFGV